jgi:hypothetical protein
MKPNGIFRLLSFFVGVSEVRDSSSTPHMPRQGHFLMVPASTAWLLASWSASISSGSFSTDIAVPRSGGQPGELVFEVNGFFEGAAAGWIFRHLPCQPLYDLHYSHSLIRG